MSTGVLAAVAACSSSPSQAGPGDAGDDETGDEPPVCLSTSACVQAPTAGQQCVTTMGATLVDPTGKPVPGIPVYLCGTNLCTEPTKTASDGTVEVAACLPFAAPAIKVFSDPDWSPFAALLTGGGPSFSLGQVTLTPLPSDGTPFPTGAGTVSSAGVSLTVTGSTTVTFDVEHQTPDSQLFRAVAIPAAAIPTSLQGQVAAAWGLGPLNTTLAPPVQLQLPNTPGWAAGAAVDVYLNGTDTTRTQPFATWGSWGLIGTGSVSADGSSIVLTPAQGGLPEIAMVGVQKHG